MHRSKLESTALTWPSGHVFRSGAWAKHRRAVLPRHAKCLLPAHAVTTTLSSGPENRLPCEAARYGSKTQVVRHPNGGARTSVSICHTLARTKYRMHIIQFGRIVKYFVRRVRGCFMLHVPPVTATVMADQGAAVNDNLTGERGSTSSHRVDLARSRVP
jgi:hypothetical protein